MLGKTFGIIAACLITSASLARPPPNPDPRLSAWFESLIDEETMLSCCGEADCRAVDERVALDHHEVFVQGAWMAVPEEKIVHRVDNPTGRAILCWSPQLGIMCFVPGSGV